MSTWIALFRGINIGGNCKLPMAQLKSELEALGLKNVRTYIQSGNVVFDAGRQSKVRLTQQIMNTVEEQHGFRPAVLLLTAAELEAALAGNPFPDAEAEPTSLHFFFLAAPATKADMKSLEQIKAASESYKLTASVFYLHTPDGLGRSKLAVAAEKKLGVTTTARNFRTVSKLRELAEC